MTYSVIRVIHTCGDDDGFLYIYSNKKKKYSNRNRNHEDFNQWNLA